MSAVLAPIVASLGAVESADGTIQTAPFLTACRLVLPVFDRRGVAFRAATSAVRGHLPRPAEPRAGAAPSSRRASSPRSGPGHRLVVTADCVGTARALPPRRGRAWWWGAASGGH